jgi:RNA polymerase subunit RPABC4/transcription elongation factor Spt4
MVNCLFHPDRNAVGSCCLCGTALCEDCRTTIGGQDYCNRCKSLFDFPIDIVEAIKKFFSRGSKCPSCGKGVEENFIVCPYCQRKLKAKCGKCGQLLEPNWVACPYCGKTKEG